MKDGELRAAIYSQDGLGLGHLRRNTLIGKQLLESRSKGNVLLVADSPVAPFFKLSTGMDHLKLPSIRKINHGEWEATGLRIDEAELRTLRAEILRHAVLKYRPDLMLVDHMPGGAKGEMLPTLKLLRSSAPKCRIVLGLRDILDAQEVIERVWSMEGAYEALHDYYDGILIYGNDNIFDSGKMYHLPELQWGIHYCGYVVNDGPVQARGKVLGDGERQDQPLVFVCAGGGGDGFPLMQTYIRAIRLLGPRPGFTSVIAAGANCPDDCYRQLELETRELPVRLIPYTDDSLSHLAAADLVVCMAGYNTLAEVLYLKKKALVVPRPGPSAEQRMRAELFAKQGLIDFLEPSQLSPENMASRLIADLERDDLPGCNLAFKMDGATQAAHRLLQILE